MATDTPDPQNLKSWQEAFQYPIPTVRKVEQELRRDIASNREKLRSMVGTRYRELLETAEAIVEMNTENQEVEEKLASLGLRCNTNLLSKKAVKSVDANQKSVDGVENNRALAAQIALLHRCTTIIGRLLRKHKSLLLASKLMVISRFLYKALSQNPDAPAFVENLSGQLDNLRKTIRKRINRKLGSANSSIEDIIDSMSAFCLSYSSSPLDVLIHFHTVRLESIVRQLERRSHARESVPKALNLYIQTLQNTKTLSSRRLPDALAKLQGQPLLTDTDIQGLGELDLDVFGRWVASDVKNFTPWIKSDSLTKQSAEQLIKKWSKEAFARFSESSAAVLKDFDSFEDVLSLRKETLDMWLSAAPATMTHSSTSVLEGIRGIFNTQLKTILLNQAQELSSIGDAAKSHIDRWNSEETKQMQSLWDPSLTSLEYSNGATTFKKVVMDTLLGRDTKVSSVLKLYDSWLVAIERSRSLIDDLKHARWEETLDDGDDDENLDNDPATLLNEDDPHLLNEEQVNATRQAFLDLQTVFNTVTQAFGDADRSSKTAFILRLIREVRRNGPSEIIQDESLSFAQDMVPLLHDILAQEILVQVPVTNLLRPLKNTAQRLPGRSLWDGNPELPNQPLPATFQYLRRLVVAMESLGPDLWSSPAAIVLKSKLSTEISESLFKKLEQLNTSVNQDEKGQKDAEQKEEETEDSVEKTADGTVVPKEDHPKPLHNTRDWKIQLALDAFYLRDALSIDHSKNNLLDGFIEKIQVEIEDSDGIIELRGVDRDTAGEQGTGLVRRGEDPSYVVIASWSSFIFLHLLTSTSPRHGCTAATVSLPPTVSVSSVLRTNRPSIPFLDLGGVHKLPHESSSRSRDVPTTARKSGRTKIPSAVANGEQTERAPQQTAQKQDSKSSVPEKEPDDSDTVKNAQADKEEISDASGTTTQTQEQGDGPPQQTKGEQKTSQEVPPPQNPLDAVLQMPQPSDMSLTRIVEDRQGIPHLAPTPYVHHFDSYSLVKDLQGGGFTEDQAITAMKAIRGILQDKLNLAEETLTSKSDSENEEYLFKAACSELQSSLQTSRHAEIERQRTSRTHLQHEADILNLRLNQELARLNDDLKGMRNDHKMTIREHQRTLDTGIQELNYKIAVSLASDGKSEAEGLRWVLTRRAALAIAFSALMAITFLKFYSVYTHDLEKKQTAAKASPTPEHVTEAAAQSETSPSLSDALASETLG
ncbi:Conserved oligomeric Golgi complex subunit 1 [Talaromyces islandicus]|uniref:Conserved oligomeric Golgi complex subunit 1 n=1 Tax=Talaromyces islandicus TaxID=28573 RepID=A0A0U1LUJ4_TALIS|nr:Conserved oligomeric Golgi complex subunit 1 [Talaromyces islandicus]